MRELVFLLFSQNREKCEVETSRLLAEMVKKLEKVTRAQDSEFAPMRSSLTSVIRRKTETRFLSQCATP